MTTEPPAMEDLLRIYNKHLESVARRKVYLQSEQGKEYNRKKAKEYYEKNKDKVLSKRKEFYEQNQEVLRQKSLEIYHKQKLKTTEA